MITMNAELKKWYELYKEQFDDVISFKMIPKRISRDELICVIKESISKNENLVPKKIFGFDLDSEKEY